MRYEVINTNSLIANVKDRLSKEIEKEIEGGGSQGILSGKGGAGPQGEGG